MAKMKMKAQANRFLLSYMWWVLEPLLFVGLFYVIFGYILQRGGEGYFQFLIVGKMTFMWFSKGITMGANSLVQNKGIIGQSSVPKWVFPIVNVQEATYRTAISFVIMILCVIYNFEGNYITWLQIIPISVMLYWFIVVLSMLLSVFVAVAEDVTQMISLLMMGMLFSSGIFWDINSIQKSGVSDLIFNVNPLALNIDLYRSVLIGGDIIDYSRFLPSLIINLSLTVVVYLVFKKGNNKITRFLFS
ncbi:ABC transporter permease [Vibrio sp. 1CM2L]|uniref:ABC transporter permease n=1 Tax=Vibrio sp. 1CM2L TaxID=2929166 RepID=UPI0020BE7EAB|nr:ABC transporter permease [Vibrio sp. 1CM2L]MCK8078688.1 ABC transporter permease [Vibrio sp. 1CM2L]